ncbi:MAG: hypothetical protein P8H03_04015, partial [Emcibacteraceae bacterium]|nr:hypothetical protein [Emcibacteraceae bacterium]
MNNKDFDASEISVFSLVKYTLRQKLIFPLFLFPFIAIGIGLFLDQTFSGNVVFTITEDQSSSSNQPPSIGGLSSIVGLSLGSGGSEKYNRLQILQSRMFLLSFIQRNNLEKVIFKDKWDNINKAWEQPSTLAIIKYSIEKYIRSNAKEPIASPPDNEKLVARFLKEHFIISEDDKTGILNLKIIWDNPEDATNIANSLVKE